MRKALMLVLGAGLLASCMTTRPPNNAGFATARSLHDLEGRYRNFGEKGKDDPSTYRLSRIIWPRRTDVPHHLIASVDVRVVNGSALHVQALSDTGSVVLEQTFVRDKDFRFRDGRLDLGGATHVPTGEGTPGLFLEMGFRQLGVDKKGQGKLAQGTTVVGAAYLVLPIVAQETHEVRFARIGD